jgi:hypothetical protein
MNYVVLSDNFGEVGSIVTDEELEGLNVEALIEGGHIEPQVADDGSPAGTPQSQAAAVVELGIHGPPAPSA